jgi:hypothetical protein
MLKAFAALDATGQQVLADDIMQLMQQFNRVGDGGLVIPGEYLEIVITRR